MGWFKNSKLFLFLMYENIKTAKGKETNTGKTAFMLVLFG